jgi:hypothetical protein
MDGTGRPDRRKERGFRGSRQQRYNGRVRRTLPATGLLVAAAFTVGVAGCGGGGATTTVASTTRSSTGTTHTTSQQSAKLAPKKKPKSSHASAGGGEPRHHPVKAAVTETKPARLDATQRRVAAVVRAYVAALDSHDGARACALFAPGALDGVNFPRGHAGCASSLGSSIGYRDPRGFPVYRGSRVARIASVSIDGADARVVATDVTDFAGNREPSIEDDVVYLHQQGGRWLIVKPSAALYRAIGVGDIPPAVLAPPK